MDSLEYTTLTQCYPKLIACVKQSPNDVVVQLTPSGILAPGDLAFFKNPYNNNDQKAERIIDSVLNQVQINPKVFDTFVSALKASGSWTETVVSELEHTLTVLSAPTNMQPRLPLPCACNSHDHEVMMRNADLGNIKGCSMSSASDHDHEEGLTTMPSPKHYTSEMRVKDVATPPTNGHSPTDITTPEHATPQAVSSDAVFVCPYCGECTMEQFSDEGCPKQVSTDEDKKVLFPYLDTTGLDEADRINLECRLKSETREIKLYFAKFTLKIVRSLKALQIPLEEIKISVLSLEAFTDGIGVKVLDEEDAQKIEAAKNVLEIFIVLRKYISFFNYHIIKHIIDEHGAARDHDSLKDYLENFHLFCRRSIFHVPQDVFQSSSRKTAKVYALKCTKGVATMDGVEEVKDEINKIFHLEPATLQLCSIKKGCVELHFLISAAVADHIFPVSPSQHSALSEIGVRVLSYEGVDQTSREEEKPQEGVHSAENRSDVTLSKDKISSSRKLVDACKRGLVSEVSSYIEQGANVNYQLAVENEGKIEGAESPSPLRSQELHYRNMEKRDSRGRARGRGGKIQCSNTHWQWRGRGRGRGQRQPRPFDISRDTERPGTLQLCPHSVQQLTENVSLSQQSLTAPSVSPVHCISKPVSVSCEGSTFLNPTPTQSHSSESVPKLITSSLEECEDNMRMTDDLTSHTQGCLPSLEASTSSIPPASKPLFTTSTCLPTLEASTSSIPPASKPLFTTSTVTQDDTLGPNDLDKKQPPNRPGFGKQGQKITVRANFFPVELSPPLILHYYEVTISRDYPKQSCRRIFQDLETKYSCIFDGQKCVFDGDKNLYCQRPLKMVDGTNTQNKILLLLLQNEVEGEAITVTLKYVKSLSITSNLQDTTERIPFVEALDIIMRNLSSKRTESIIDGFSFSRPDHPQIVGQGLEAWPGYCQSLRPTMEWKLMLNLDTSLKAFYPEQSVIDFTCRLLRKERARDATPEASAQAYKHFQEPLEKNEINRLKKEISGLKIQTTHLSSSNEYKVLSVTCYSAQTFEFQPVNRKTEHTCTVAEYYKKCRNKELKYPHLPCLYVGSNKYFPLELCQIMRQRCGKNLKSMQKLRKESESGLEEEIKQRLVDSGIARDPVLKDFGISVSDEMMEIPARVFSPPPLMYGCDQTVRPPQDKGIGETRGRIRFYEGARINGFAMLVFSKKVISGAEIDRFTKLLISIGSEKGMIFQGEKIVQLENRDPKQTELIKRTFEELKTRVNLIIAIIDKGSHVYNTIKFFGDTTDPGLATQCVTTRTIQKYCTSDIIESLCLKINPKLGGVNSIIDPSFRPAFFQKGEEPVIIFGADVTHAKAGDTTSLSIAAVVASMDLTASKFKGKHHVQTHRQEVIANLKEMASNLLVDFSQANGEKKPSQIIFYRNGENGGEFNEVYFKEVEALQQACRELKPDNPPGITFIVVQNCPHVHLFPVDPKDGGKSNRVPVGTIVEHEITHPDEFDFYLCSHASGQPCHYRVLWDDNALSADDLQIFSYQLCHTFWRSKHSVLYPAPVGYARQAAAHARALSLSYQECASSDMESEDSCDAGISQEALNEAISIHMDRNGDMYFL